MDKMTQEKWDKVLDECLKIEECETCGKLLEAHELQHCDQCWKIITKQIMGEAFESVLGVKLND